MDCPFVTRDTLFNINGLAVMQGLQGNEQNKTTRGLKSYITPRYILG